VNNRLSKLRSLLSTIGIFVAAPILALILINFVFQPYQVDGSSMEKTLQNNDRLIIWKLPKTISKITGNPYIPKRNDIIVFSKPELHEANGKGKQLIKRVVGLPGERVVVKDGKITIYNATNPNGFNPDINQDYSANLPAKTGGDVDKVIPKNYVFVCGDNRPGSLDSRTFGPIPVEDIVGKLTVRFLPMGKFDRF
jgi:signal peptidase I